MPARKMLHRKTPPGGNPEALQEERDISMNLLQLYHMLPPERGKQRDSIPHTKGALQSFGRQGALQDGGIA